MFHWKVLNIEFSTSFFVKGGDVSFPRETLFTRVTNSSVFGNFMDGKLIVLLSNNRLIKIQRNLFESC